MVAGQRRYGGGRRARAIIVIVICDFGSHVFFSLLKIYSIILVYFTTFSWNFLDLLIPYIKNCEFFE
jgi:hypothetical protein